MGYLNNAEEKKEVEDGDDVSVVYESVGAATEEEWTALREAEEDIFEDMLIKRIEDNGDLSQWSRRDLEMYASLVGNDRDTWNGKVFTEDVIKKLVDRVMDMYMRRTPPSSVDSEGSQ